MKLHNPLVYPQYSLVGRRLSESVFNPALLDDNRIPRVMLEAGTVLTADLVELLAWWGVETIPVYGEVGVDYVFDYDPTEANFAEAEEE